MHLSVNERTVLVATESGEAYQWGRLDLYRSPFAEGEPTCISLSLSLSHSVVLNRRDLAPVFSLLLVLFPLASLCVVCCSSRSAFLPSPLSSSPPPTRLHSPLVGLVLSPCLPVPLSISLLLLLSLILSLGSPQSKLVANNCVDSPRIAIWSALLLTPYSHPLCSLSSPPLICHLSFSSLIDRRS